jgi:uncharacterized protein (TIGR02145 family)
MKKMKKLQLLIISLVLAGTLSAQAPQSLKYQAIARNSEGVAIANSPIGLQFSIVADNANGNTVYSETFTASSNVSGVFNVNIGTGNVESGNFPEIDWGSDSYFLKASMDVNGGSNYIEMGTSQLLSVPYSLYTASIYVQYSNDTLYIGDKYVVISGGGSPPAGTVTDYDGNVYETVVIGTQTWMKENLRSQHYADGSAIEGVYAYEDNESYVSDYGRLYLWNAVMAIGKSAGARAQGVCPDGWHVPSKDEGITLQDFLGGHMEAGGKLKETGYTYWDEPNTGATNESGFSSRGSGQRGQTGNYTNLQRSFQMWTSTENGEKAYHLSNLYNSDNTAFEAHVKTIGFSVRCLKD